MKGVSEMARTVRRCKEAEGVQECKSVRRVVKEGEWLDGVMKRLEDDM